MEIAVWAAIMMVTVSLSVLVALYSRKRIKNVHRPEYNDYAAPMLGVVATLFAVLLGFLVAQSLTNYEDIRGKVADEANRLGDIFLFAGSLPDARRVALREDCRRYCQETVDSEWPNMEQGNFSENVQAATISIWQEILSFEPKTNRESNIQQSLMAAAQQMNENRRSRLMAMHTQLSPVLWLVVITGCIILVVFSCFFFVESTLLQCTVIALVALSLVCNLMLLHVYSNPFRGVLKISSDPFNLERTWFAKPEATLPTMLRPAAHDHH